MKEHFELEKSKNEYLSYIVEHRNFVQMIWKYTKDEIANSKIISHAELKIIDELIINHDKSKFFDVEFEGYRSYFYPTNEDKDNEFAINNFEVAWNHHQKNNPHHWNYWVLVNGIHDIHGIPMPVHYVVEMLCDWSAMSIKFKDKPSEYYLENRDNMLLHEETIKNIESLIFIFDKNVEILKKEKR